MKKSALKKLWLRYRPLCSKIARFVAHTSLPEIAFVSSFIMGHYLLNADFQYPSEMIVPVVFFALLATVLYYFYRLVLRSFVAARLATLPLLYALYSYSYLPGWIQKIGKGLLPFRFESAFSNATLTALFLMVCAGLFAYGVVLLIKNFALVRHLQLHRVVLFAVLFIFLIQFVKVGGRLVQLHKQLSYRYPAPNFTRVPNTPVQKPDIYYFVFDRYANASTLKNVYNYDNSGLTDYLSSQGFVTRSDARANYPFTMQSISSTLAMQYHTGLAKLFNNGNYQAAFAYRSILNDPPIAQVLKQNGYTYNQVSSWWDFTRYAVKADGNQTKSFRLRVFGKNFYMSDLSRDIVNKSIMSPWLKKGMTIGHEIVVKYDNDNNPRQNFFEQEAAIKTLASSAHSTPQFTFAHFLAPHDPYIFDADGSDPAYDGGRNDSGEDETVKYVEEIKYLNTQIKSMMDTIRAQSPGAVIIIQSDEGPYPKEFRFKLAPGHYYDPSNLPLLQEQQKYGILASYYMPGVDAETVKANITASVNPFRFILKQYLGYDIDMLPDCQFSAADKFKIYNFKNETPKLQSNAAKACASL